MNRFEIGLSVAHDIKQHYRFSARLGHNNTGFSLRDEVLPTRELPVSNVCYTFAVLVAYLMASKGSNPLVHISYRTSLKRIFPIHALASFIDTSGDQWFLDIVARGRIVLSRGCPPHPYDRIIETYSYDGQDTLGDLLSDNHSSHYLLLKTKFCIDQVFPKEWPCKKNLNRRQRRADRLNHLIQLPGAIEIMHE